MKKLSGLANYFGIEMLLGEVLQSALREKEKFWLEKREIVIKFRVVVGRKKDSDARGSFLLAARMIKKKA